MIVIGTAGHIDHGKSAIVRRLTGTDPDRLPEEKARGMTIDLGFAFYQTGDDVIALVDVPGHERFVKNMIAGVGGIDAVMLVVAADDGWMPQSEEHFQIARLLGVRYGLIVINKTDLAEPDWLQLLEHDIRERVTGSFLEKAPLFKVSAATGDGFDKLTAFLNDFPGRIRSRKDIGKARLYIDRSFIRPGIGCVITGTLHGGTLKVGQTVTVWPGRVSGKVRTLQSNNRKVEEAVPGQRTAVSLTGVDREQLLRGGVISDRIDLNFFYRHPLLALSVEMLHNAPVLLTDRRRVLIITGTTEIEGEIRLYERKEIGPSENGIIFFKPDEPVYTLVHDHYILRLPTPMVTLGGGVVLDHLEHLPRRRNLAQYEYLKERTSPQLGSLVISELKRCCLVAGNELLRNADYGPSEITDVVASLTSDGIIGQSREYIFHTETLRTRVDLVKERVAGYLHEKPHHSGLSADQLQSLVDYCGDALNNLLDYMVAEGILTRSGELYNLAGRGIALTGVIKQAHDEMITTLKAHPYDPPSLSQLASGGKVHQQAIKYMLDTREAYKCGSDFLFLDEAWKDIVAFIREKLNADDKLTVADLREKFGCTRKYVIPILEEMDRTGLTVRHGDYRVKGERFEEDSTA